ncbi:MAG: fibrillarin-like rRNA/tRNA 2'-O-methyltransferase [Methanomicrobiales archaeon]|nr:fibrillarin-like rRNA/tRNA 2'-O-methyltransferase [Methanomicrobiales archaeon]
MKWIEGNLVSPGRKSLYGERLCGGYRKWDPRRSKLAALITADRTLTFSSNQRVLYLGAGHGTTASHLADYVEVVYAVEIAPRPFQDLLRICHEKENIIPLLNNAIHPASYAPFVETVDILYQDVAQPSQAEIAIRNHLFLRPGGILILMLKTACVDSTRLPEEVFGETVESLGKAYTVQRTCWLSPHFPDHAAIVAEAIK